MSTYNLRFFSQPTCRGFSATPCQCTRSEIGCGARGACRLDKQGNLQTFEGFDEIGKLNFFFCQHHASLCNLLDGGAGDVIGIG